MSKNFKKWLLFIALSLTWGSSFILIKIGLENQLTAYQVAAIRILTAGILLLPVAIRNFKKIPSNRLGLVFISGSLGSLLPAFLFCLAEEGIDSSLAGTLNCLTPIFVILTGAVFFQMKTPRYKIWGILIAFAGSFLLLFSKGHLSAGQQFIYICFVILATICYGLNINIVARYLTGIVPIHIASVALVLNAIPALVILICSGYFSLSFHDVHVIKATGAAALMGLLGTAMATVFFYMLVKTAGGLFASMVTYGIPFVAVGWGIYFGEIFGLAQVGCLLIILTGVYWANKKVTDEKLK